LLSIVYGSAFEVEGQEDDYGNVRVYRTGGRTFIGHDSFDIAHVCNRTCLSRIIDGSSLWPVDLVEPRLTWEPAGGDSYVQLLTLEYSDRFPTADVHNFDPGDDPYIRCAACGTELLRDDERFEAEFGHPIHPQGWKG
jgi:hypothetical protein